MNLCKQCNKEIKTPPNIFCNRSCSAKYNNRHKQCRIKPEQHFNCLNCNIGIIRRPSQIAKGHILYCSTSCMHDHRNKRNEQERMQQFKAGKLTSRHQLRKIIFKRDVYQCSCCKLTTWQSQPIPLWLDHIDGNASNNIPENLRLICLNCDALGNTFGNKNRGKGRRSLGLKPWA